MGNSSGGMGGSLRSVELSLVGGTPAERAASSVFDWLAFHKARNGAAISNAAKLEN